jgi:transposase
MEAHRAVLPTDVRGVERVDDRRVICGIVQVLKSGCRWRLPGVISLAALRHNGIPA